MIGTKYIYFLFLCTVLASACNKKATTNNATTEARNIEKTISPIGSWTVISFPTDSKDSKAAETQKSYIVNFDADNSMGLTLDVNTCGTSYKAKDDMITFQEGMTCTEACCDSKEANFLTRQFRGSLKYSIEGSTMTIKTDKGPIQLINNKDGIIGTSWTAVSYQNLKSDEPIKFEKKYRLSFDKKRVNLNLDVNACNTEITYSPQISTLEMPKAMGCTRKCCDSKEGVALMNSLKGKIVYKKTGKQLTLSTSTQEINFVLYKELSKEE
jgi:heat shock protein HslJ